MKKNIPPTYEIGLIQAQAYRNLQAIFRDTLVPFGLTIPEWSILGIVRDRGEIGLSQLAELLQSKASHSTVLVEGLKNRNLIDRVTASGDKRAKIVKLTPNGSKLVLELEPIVRAHIGKALSGIERHHLEAYYETLVSMAHLNHRH